MFANTEWLILKSRSQVDLPIALSKNLYVVFNNKNLIRFNFRRYISFDWNIFEKGQLLKDLLRHIGGSNMVLDGVRW